ncbi:putative crustin-like antimicrobial peptide 10 [Homarus americanus]|uniref:Putative crustin-like antimicrobial peptide 10 n=1 Tax=Homarus americanus TaxID=6706 RepID=A0A8J5N0D4_HOMAM|nr:putative crustin-like antimicrobial peptide 10 [Homarus americanus]
MQMKLVWLLVVGVASVAADKKEKTAARVEGRTRGAGNTGATGSQRFLPGLFGGNNLGGGLGGNPVGGFGGGSPIGGFGGGHPTGGGSPVNPPSGCRYWCRTPKGQAYCCENVNEPQSFAGVVKPGQCPPVRPVCPLVKSFGPPSSCSNDGACGGVDKCCFDTCLQQHTCKAPYGFGR